MPGPDGAVVVPSAFSVSEQLVANPACASSTALSMISNAMWCRPDPSSVSPMYMPGRLRTASRPRRTEMESAPYSALPGVASGRDAAGSDMP